MIASNIVRVRTADHFREASLTRTTIGIIPTGLPTIVCGILHTRPTILAENGFRRLHLGRFRPAFRTRHVGIAILTAGALLVGTPRTRRVARIRSLAPARAAEEVTGSRIIVIRSLTRAAPIVALAGAAAGVVTFQSQAAVRISPGTGLPAVSARVRRRAATELVRGRRGRIGKGRRRPRIVAVAGNVAKAAFPVGAFGFLVRPPTIWARSATFVGGIAPAYTAKEMIRSGQNGAPAGFPRLVAFLG